MDRRLGVAVGDDNVEIVEEEEDEVDSWSEKEHWAEEDSLSELLGEEKAPLTLVEDSPNAVNGGKGHHEDEEEDEQEDAVQDENAIIPEEKKWQILEDAIRKKN